MAMFIVTITNLASKETSIFGSRHRAEDAWEAVDKAVKKRWGKNASFWRDNGISVGKNPTDGRQYGQITEPIKGNPGSHNCITGRVAIDVR